MLITGTATPTIDEPRAMKIIGLSLWVTAVKTLAGRATSAVKTIGKKVR
jgi:hypothetical protein